MPMHFLLRISPVMLVLLAAQASGRVQDYRIDPVHTQVLFSVDHNGFSYPVGRLRVKAGWLRFDEDDWKSAKVVVDIDTASVDLGDQAWNSAVAGKRFLDATDFPLAHFESTSVLKTSSLCTPESCVGARSGPGLLKGNLTLRGITHEIALPFTVNRVGATIFGMQTLAGFSAHATLDRMQFGMSAFPKAVGQSVEVRLEVEAILDQDAQQQYEAGKNGNNNKGMGDAAAQH